MKNVLKPLSLSLFTLVLFIGCGSSVTKKINKALTKENAHYIKGVYDISTKTDKLYFVVENSGLVNTYTFNTNSNCYDKNKSPGLNSSINGKKVLVDFKDRDFELESARWYYGGDKKITSVSSHGYSSAEILETNNIRIATTKHLTNKVTLGELNQSICK